MSKTETKQTRKIRSAYDGDRVRVFAPVGDDGLTEQAHAELCDVNKLMAKYSVSGVIPQKDASKARYLDCPSEDFSEAMLLVKNAEREFASLPSKLRSKFGNSPGKMVDELENNPNLRSELEDMGILEKPAAVPPMGSESKPLEPQEKKSE